MDRVFRKLMDEWERTVLYTVLAMLLVYLGCIVYRCLNEDEEAAQDTAKMHTPHSYFANGNFDFLYPAKIEDGVNPLIFTGRVALPPPVKPDKKADAPNAKPKDGGGKKEEAAKPQQQTASADKPKEQTKQPAKPAPPKVHRKIAVSYRGFVKGPAGQVAFYSAVDSKGKKTEAKAAELGAKMHGILEIKSFDGDKIVLGLNGKEHTVVKGKKQEIQVD